MANVIHKLKSSGHLQLYHNIVEQLKHDGHFEAKKKKPK